MYVDDTGAMKGLADNTRAAGLAAAAGHPCEVHGDAFVGRVIDCDDKFERLDFTLKEARARTRLRLDRCLTRDTCRRAQVDSSAAWIADAQARNARRRDNASRLSELAPGATRIDTAAASAFAADAEDAAKDASQQPVAGKLYTYSQDSDEVVVEVKVPAATKSKDVACTVKPDTVSLTVATLPEGQRDVLCGELFQRVKADESSWTIASMGGERVLQLTLAKQKSMRWLGVLRSG